MRANTTEATKICKECGVSQLSANFTRHRSVCKTCRVRREKARQAENRELIRKKALDYYYRNQEERRAKGREYQRKKSSEMERLRFRLAEAVSLLRETQGKTDRAILDKKVRKFLSRLEEESGSA